MTKAIRHKCKLWKVKLTYCCFGCHYMVENATIPSAAHTAHLVKVNLLACKYYKLLLHTGSLTICYMVSTAHHRFFQPNWRLGSDSDNQNTLIGGISNII
jgi:hypothetical protein